jgi:hypothetical protein
MSKGSQATVLNCAKKHGGMLNLDFWKDFSRRFWEKEPVVIRNAFSPTLVRGEQLFALLKAICARYRPSPGRRSEMSGTSESRRVEVRVWIDNSLVQTDLGMWLPTELDDSYLRYIDRTQLACSGRSFSMMLNRLHVHEPGLWEGFRKFFHQLYEFVGPPPGGADSDVMIGRYVCTGFGVHLDSASNFTLVVEGNKTILAWPNEFFPPGMAQTIRYEQYRDSAYVLSAQKGDVIYWPSSFWHVGESYPEPSMTLQLAYYFSPTSHQRLVDALCRDVKGAALDGKNHLTGRGQDDEKCGLGFDGTSSPFLKRVEAALEAHGKPIELRDRAELIEACYRSASCFFDVPPAVAGRPHNDQATYRKVAATPVYFLPLSHYRAAIIANGLVAQVSHDERGQILTEFINSGKAFDRGHLLQIISHVSEECISHRTYVDETLSILEGFRAVATLDHRDDVTPAVQ